MASRFERGYLALCMEISGADTPFDGESVMSAFSTVGVPGGEPTCGSVRAVKRALKHVSGLSEAAIQRRLGELVGTVLTGGHELTRSGPTKFEFVSPS